MSIKLARGLTTDHAIRNLVTTASIEILPADIKKFDTVAPKLAPGTRVYIAYTSGWTDEIIAAAEEVRRRGLNPVPHFPARRFHSVDELRGFIGDLAHRAKITNALLIGGDLYQPVGPFNCVLDMLKTGMFEANGIEEIGFAGHPEGHPDVPEDVLRQALLEKCAYAQNAGMSPYLATQFLFDVPKLVSWQSNFVATTVPGLPVDVGLPGFAKISTLLKFAKNCGVAASASMLMKHAGKALLLASAFSPDEILHDVAEATRRAGSPIFRSVHLYPFGSLERTADWLKTLRQQSEALQGA